MSIAFLLNEEITGEFYVKRNKVLYCIENGTGEKAAADN